MIDYESKFPPYNEDEAFTDVPYLVCDADSVDEVCSKYLADCNGRNLVSGEQELEIQLASFGDEEAILKLFEANKRRVFIAARNYSGRGVEFDDLVQEGSIALIKAIETFDKDMGNRFGDYVNLLIQRSMINALMNHSRTIRIAKHMFNSLGELYSLDKQSNRDLSVDEVSSKLSVKPVKAEKIMKFDEQSVSSIESVGIQSMDEIMYEKGLTDLSSEDIVMQELDREYERQDLLDSMEAVLSEREKKVISMRFGLDTGDKQTVAEVGKTMGVSRQFINKIENRSIKKLRKFYGLE